jgi:hypothetical protein
MNESGSIEIDSGRPLLAGSRSPGKDFQRLLLRLQTLRLYFSAAIVDPFETLK